MFGNLNVLLHMRCGIPKTFDYMINDKSVLEIFRVYEKKLVINLSVSHMDIILLEDGDILIHNLRHSQENLRTKKNVGGQDSGKSNNKDDELYLFFSNESWMHS